MGEAAKLPVNQKESLEQAAFLLISQKLKV